MSGKRKIKVRVLAKCDHLAAAQEIARWYAELTQRPPLNSDIQLLKEIIDRNCFDRRQVAPKVDQQ